MAVPDTTTFTLQDVADEFGLGSNDGLTDCFDEATSSDFDVLYEGNKDELLNFRNYGGIATRVSFSSSLADKNPCSLALDQTFWFVPANSSQTIPAVSNTVFANSTGATKAPTGNHRFISQSGSVNSSMTINSIGIISSQVAC
tara:strand:+ start:31 stop:459 length:429 start_codon:yes stop_codon:yes gene_type:complete